MLKDLNILWDFCNDKFNNISLKDDNSKYHYARKLYYRVLMLTQDIMILLSSKKEKAYITTPNMLRGLIEAAIDIENLNAVQDYEKYLEIIYLGEQVVFLKKYNEDYMHIIHDAVDYSNKLQEKKDRYNLLKKEILDSKLNIINTNDLYDLTKTSFKFKLINSLSENCITHRKYTVFYDLLCAHSHNNIGFIEKEGLNKVADLKENEEYYFDLIGSILKNGLLNIMKINNIKIEKEFNDKITILKRNVKSIGDYNIDIINKFLK